MKRALLVLAGIFRTPDISSTKSLSLTDARANEVAIWHRFPVRMSAVSHSGRARSRHQHVQARQQGLIPIDKTRYGVSPLGSVRFFPPLPRTECAFVHLYPSSAGELCGDVGREAKRLCRPETMICLL